MKGEQEKMQGEYINLNDGDEAYETLINWVKSVPNAIREIEESGTEEDLIRYKIQIKMVVEKMQEIESKLPKK